MHDLAWRDAMANTRIRRAFTDGERSMGWPITMQPGQLAHMQRPSECGDTVGRRCADALRDALEAECKGGRLPHECKTITKHQKPAAPLEPSPFASREWLSEFAAPASNPPAQSAPTVSAVFLIAPGDFAAWLAGNGMAPSQHVAAWFKAYGVATPQAVPSATAAPQAGLAAADVTDWPTLVQYRQQFAGVPWQQRPQWGRGHVALLADWVQGEYAANRGRGALGRAAKALGYERGERISQLFKGNGFDAKGQAVALGGVWASGERRAG